MVYKYLATFTSDGTLDTTAWRPRTRSVGNGSGEWVRTGNREFALTLPLVWLKETDPANVLKARATLRLSPNLVEAGGPFRVDLLDPEGEGHVVTSGGGTIHGRRIQLE